MPNESKETVVLLHGLGMMGWVMAPLGLRLRRCGYRAVNLTWHDLRAPLRENAARLKSYVASLPGEKLHFVGHSLGGLLVLRMLVDSPDPRTARIVLAGTPYHGSHVAHFLAKRAATRWILGRSGRHGLLDDRPEWKGQFELGVIAGTRSLGLGLLVPGLGRPNDGLVAVEETRVPGARDQVVVRVSHTEMLISRKVAAQVCAFLKNGKFNH